MAIGTNNAETVTGTNASETIDGRRGNDNLRGLLGSDTYLLRAGDGQDNVLDTGGAADALRFDASVARAGVRLFVDTGDTDDLFVINDATGDRIEIEEQFNGTANRIESIIFANGDPAISLTLPLTFTGSAASEVVYGTIGSDTIVGRTGNDTLRGLTGDDVYRFKAADGQDTIIDTGGLADSIRFESTVARSAVRLQVDTGDTDDLFVINDATGDRIEIEEQFNGTANALEAITFANGDVTIDLLAPLTFNGSAAGEIMYGTLRNDTIVGRAGNDTLRGLIGDDVYRFKAADGQDTIIDSGGLADSIRFESSVLRSTVRLVVDTGDTDDLIVINDATGDRIEIEEQFNGTVNRIESITFARGNSTLNLTAPLTFTGSADGETLYGTTGNDTIVGRGGNDTYRFTSGDGLDSIFDSGGLADSISFDASVARSAIKFSRDPGDRDDLLITNTASGARVEVDEHFSGTVSRVETLLFADGSSIDLTALAIA